MNGCKVIKQLLFSRVLFLLIKLISLAKYVSCTSLIQYFSANSNSWTDTMNDLLGVALGVSTVVNESEDPCYDSLQVVEITVAIQ